jgi:hypothetical protein
MMVGMDVDAAAAMGFKREQAEQSLAVLDALAFPESSFGVAMDLARFVQIPLLDATLALIHGGRRLRQLGIDIPKVVDSDPLTRLAAVDAVVYGQAKAYAGTFYGSLDVREAQGHTFTAVFLRFVESVFGPR